MVHPEDSDWYCTAFLKSQTSVFEQAQLHCMNPDCKDVKTDNNRVPDIGLTTPASAASFFVSTAAAAVPDAAYFWFSGRRELWGTRTC
jgi:hypothetical protein